MNLWFRSFNRWAAEQGQLRMRKRDYGYCLPISVYRVSYVALLLGMSKTMYLNLDQSTCDDCTLCASFIASWNRSLPNQNSPSRNIFGMSSITSWGNENRLPFLEKKA